MEMGEKIAIQNIQDEMENCPFNEDKPGVSKKENEDIAKDDKDNVQKLQANNGGTLGSNLNDGSNGAEGTWEKAPYPPTDAEKDPANDSKRKNGIDQSAFWKKAWVPKARNIKADVYPYTVAAHHLIPGNASLYHKKSLLKDYMIKGETVNVDDNSWKIKYHIGYNVNGAHNGVWLPGNYAIRTGSSPTGVTWGKMSNKEWQLNYVAACSSAVGGQFHDAHTEYNKKVRTLLNKIAVEIGIHQAECELCKNKTGNEIPPPYFIKPRLYKLSNYFKTNLTLEPSGWRRPWFTSDRWRKLVFKGRSTKPSIEFVEAFNQSYVIEKE
jgi:hypothetical protein